MYSFGKSLGTKDKILQFLTEKDAPVTKADIKIAVGGNIYQYIDPLKKSGAIRETSDGKLTLSSRLFRTAIVFDQVVREFDHKK
jgi:hypothetical protein